MLHSNEDKVIMKGRLGPGMMISVNLESGEVSKNFSHDSCSFFSVYEIYVLCLIN